jgi:rSAM/selenodomain-associated transferase 2
MNGFSVIIPTLNEEGTIGACIRSARAQHPAEIIVVDGGSQDGTVAQAREANLVLTAPRGRAAQMNAGVEKATGKSLLFLHADCELASSALVEATSLLAKPGIAAGCFSMTVRAEGALYRSIDACASARVRLTGLMYGDQGLFVRRADFEAVGGFPPLRFMEDVFLSRLLCRRGRIAVARAKIFVSPRRWQKAGLLRQSVRNWALTALAASGIHPDRLAAAYPVVR